jgi:branched-chain amino acid aminotransferase
MTPPLRTGLRARGAPVPDRPVWIDGAIRRGADATLSVFDRGARDGEGLFETVRVENGCPFRWERHMERLVLSAAELGFPVPPSPAELRDGLAELLAAAGLAAAVARITVTRGIPGGRPTRAGCWMDVEPLAARLWAGTRRGGAAAILSRRPFAPGPLGRHKTTSRLAWHLAREEARSAGADEAILADARGEILEGSASNVFAIVGDELATPPASSGVLPGITREFVLVRCALGGMRVRTGPLWRAELLGAREVFLTNCVQGVVPVTTLAGEARAAGPLAVELRAAWLDALRADCGAAAGRGGGAPAGG